MRTNHKVTIALVLTTTDSTTQLMKLTETEMIGIFNQHNCGVRHVNANLDYSRAN